MKWIDYREKLGVGFKDDDKFEMLSNIVRNYVEVIFQGKYDFKSYFDYCQMVGEEYSEYRSPEKRLSQSFNKCDSLECLLSKYIAFYNTYKPNSDWYNPPIPKKAILDNLKKKLKDMNIQFELIEDKDGVFVFPKGAKELDDALVSQPLEWLKDYPKTREVFVLVLKQYSDGEYIRDTADNLRKALEEFLREFLGNDKNLENNKVEIYRYLGKQGVDPDLSGLFKQIINTYKNVNDKCVKHHDKIDEKLLEFLLYQTGLLIRMVLSVKCAETKESGC